MLITARDFLRKEERDGTFFRPLYSSADVLTSHESFVQASSRLWYRVFNSIMSEHYPHLTYRSLLADAAAMIMLKNPRELNGVLVMDNLFGDVLSDEASGIVGSLGLSPSASLCGLEGTSVGLCGSSGCRLTCLFAFSDIPARSLIQTNQSTAPHPISQARASQTPSPLSSPPQCSSDTHSISPNMPKRLRKRSRGRLMNWG